MGLAAFVSLVAAAQGASLGRRIQETISASAAGRGAFWGISIVEVSSGRPVLEWNSGRFFVPASNTKLFTTALGLVRLGAEHRFHTTVTTAHPPDALGRVGSVRLVGGGDPNLSARAIPYRPGPAPPGNPLAAIEDLADQVVARGVRRVEGDIIGDDTAYVWEPFPAGWAVDDPIWDYGAGVSALTLGDNTLSLTVLPGREPGDLARLDAVPTLPYYDIDNRVRTVAAGERKILADREPGSRQLRLWGVIPVRDRGETVLLGIDEPALYAARALSSALAARGVAVTGRPVACHFFPNQERPAAAGGVELARRTSAPLIESLRVIDKVSQNLHAEMILRAVGRERRGLGSRQAGLEEMKLFLDEAGVPNTAYRLNDGSGLGRLNLVTPAAVVALLRYMHGSPRREEWLSLLPVAGQDGTLDRRFTGTLAAGRIRAKTGTLSYVSALSGYADRRRGGRLAFSILVNNFTGTDSEARAIVDTIGTLMLE